MLPSLAFPDFYTWKERAIPLSLPARCFCSRNNKALPIHFRFLFLSLRSPPASTPNQDFCFSWIPSTKYTYTLRKYLDIRIIASMFCRTLALAVAVGSAVAQRPAATSICDYYTTALLMNNTAANQMTLLTLVVNTAVIGNCTFLSSRRVEISLTIHRYNTKHECRPRYPRPWHGQRYCRQPSPILQRRSRIYKHWWLCWSFCQLPRWWWSCSTQDEHACQRHGFQPIVSNLKQ
jgi:hypothetical protein